MVLSLAASLTARSNQYSTPTETTETFCILKIPQLPVCNVLLFDLHAQLCLQIDLI